MVSLPRKITRSAMFRNADLRAADASVTQSALEEALASKMQGGNTIGSTISNVFRSRYLPK